MISQNKFLAEAMTTGYIIKELLNYGGGENDNAEIKKIECEYGINHRMTLPYTTEQSRTSER